MAVRSNVVDLALAGVLCLVGVAEALAGSYGDAVWLGVAGSAVSAAPMAARRSAPLLSVLVLAATLAAVLRYGEGTVPDSLALLAVWTLATYSVAAYAGLLPALAGLALSAGLPVLVMALGSFSAGEVFTPTDLAFVAVPWVAGRSIRAYRAQARQLEATARQLREEREQYAVAAVSLERARLARDVHDVVAHTVSSIAVQADAAEATLSTDPETTRMRLARIQEAAADAVDDMRGLFGALRDPSAETRPQPGLQDLAPLVEESRQSGLRVQLSLGVDDLPDGRALCVYRVVQEALTNVRRHASATLVTVEVERTGSGVRVEVTDDGTGISATHSGGYGLIGIRERVEAYAGSLEVAARPNGGTRLVVELPDGAS